MSAATVCADFREFVKYTELNDLGNSYDEAFLADYILAWLEYGDAVIESGGDFGLYMEGVAFIINRWHHDPSVTDYAGPEFGVWKPRERRVRLIWLNPTEGLSLREHGPQAFQEGHFKAVLYRRMIKGSGA